MGARRKARDVTADELAEMARLYRAGVELNEIARRLDRNRGLVWRWAVTRLGHKPRRRGQTAARVLRLHKAGYTGPEIVDATGLSRTQVYDHLSRSGLTPHRPKRRTPRAETEEELDRLIERRRATAPAWFWKEADHSAYDGPRYGRAAEYVKTKCGRVIRKGKK